jgi:peptidoglycan/LPS O-acetylase OafA/YrhL
VLPLLEVRHHTVQPQTTLWLFLLGWAAARAASNRQRLLVSAVAVLVTPGFFFDDPRREALVAAGVLLLTWVPTVPVPRPLHRVIGPLAAASLAIYLTHWHVFPAVVARTSPAVGVLASLAVGLAVHALLGRLPDPAGVRAILATRRSGRRSGHGQPDAAGDEASDLVGRGDRGPAVAASPATGPSVPPGALARSSPAPDRARARS